MAVKAGILFSCQTENFENNDILLICICFLGISQWEKSPNKQLKECVFVNSALKIQCRVVKNTLLQAAFSAILRLLNIHFRRNLPWLKYIMKLQI